MNLVFLVVNMAPQQLASETTPLLSANVIESSYERSSRQKKRQQKSQRNTGKLSLFGTFNFPSQYYDW
jgi:hypothetical protein